MELIKFYRFTVGQERGPDGVAPQFHWHSHLAVLLLAGNDAVIFDVQKLRRRQRGGPVDLLGTHGYPLGGHPVYRHLQGKSHRLPSSLGY